MTTNQIRARRKMIADRLSLSELVTLAESVPFQRLLRMKHCPESLLIDFAYYLVRPWLPVFHEHAQMRLHQLHALLNPGLVAGHWVKWVDWMPIPERGAEMQVSLIACDWLDFVTYAPLWRVPQLILNKHRRERELQEHIDQVAARFLP